MITQKKIQTGKVDLTGREDVNIQSNVFDLSYDHKTSFNISQLIPVGMWECLPGDIVHCDSEGLVRFAPMLAPVMQRMNLRLEYFFVPNRLNWKNWESFISPPTEGFTPPAMPSFVTTPNTILVNSLAQYLGLPVGVSVDTSTISALPFAAYWRLIYDWYDDENFRRLITEPDLQDSTNNDWTAFNILWTRMRDRDYFTSLLPWPQKGADVVIPVTVSGAGGSIPISVDKTRSWDIFTVDGGNLSTSSNEVKFSLGGTPQETLQADETGGPGHALGIDPGTALTGDSSGITFSTTGIINDLRTAAAVQRWLEADSFGTLYIELMRNHFGVIVEDFRLQRAEFLGSSIEPIMISEVLQTAPSATTPLADMAGHGISVHRSSHYSYRCKEHGFFMVIASVLPTNTYSQGLHRMWRRMHRLDFAWPALANVGYQDVKNWEIYYQNLSTDNDVFGYNPRYQEYRTMFSVVSGEFATNLNYWHLANDFTSRPTLTEPFIYWTVPDTERIFAVIEDTVSHLYCHFFHKMKMSRKLPRFSVPMLR